MIESFSRRSSRRVSSVVAVTAAAAMLLAPAPAAADDKGWDTAGSIGRDALVVAAFGVPLAQGDWKGDEQAAFSLGSAFLVTEGLKQVIHEERPDGSNDQSFPSGHTSVSFAAAATLERRYGWKAGLPAHLVAAFVGVSRVESRKHFVGDVLAGAAIGEASGWLLTSPKNSAVKLVPWGDAHGGGVLVAARF